MTFMDETRFTSKPGCVATVFRCAAPNAKAVFLAGDFNGWSDYASPVQKSADGFWTVALALLPGRYEFKFIVDGQWVHEAGSDGPYDGRAHSLANPFGTMNRVIDVQLPTEPLAFELGAVGTEFVQQWT